MKKYKRTFKAFDVRHKNHIQDPDAVCIILIPENKDRVAAKMKFIDMVEQPGYKYFDIRSSRKQDHDKYLFNGTHKTIAEIEKLEITNK